MTVTITTGTRTVCPSMRFPPCPIIWVHHQSGSGSRGEWQWPASHTLLAAIFSDAPGRVPHRCSLIMCSSWLMFSNKLNILVSRPSWDFCWASAGVHQSPHPVTTERAESTVNEKWLILMCQGKLDAAIVPCLVSFPGKKLPHFVVLFCGADPCAQVFKVAELP